MLKIELITKETDFFALGGKWNSLLQKSEANNIFLSWEWISHWWDTFKEEKTLCVLTVYQDEILIGLAPFYLRKIKFYGLIPVRELLFLGTGENVRSEYLDLIAAPKNEASVAREVFSYLKHWNGWDIAFLKDFRSTSSFLLLMDQPELVGSIKVQHRGDNCYHIRLPKNYDEYLSDLDPKMRRNIRNRRRNLERDFNIKFKIPFSHEAIDLWWKSFTNLHQSRMSHKGLPGKFNDERYRDFHQALIEDLAGNGSFYPSILCCDGNPVAARYGFIFDKKVSDYQTGYDPAYSRQGVMQALISYLIEESICRGYREFDFLAGDEDYKRRFSNRVRRIHSLTVYTHNMTGRLCRMLVGLRHLQKRTRWPKQPLRVILSPFYRQDTYRMYRVEFSCPPPLPKLLPEGEFHEIISPEDPTLSKLANLKGLDSPYLLSQRIKRGDRCLVFFVGGRAVSFVWVARKQWYQDDFGPHQLSPGIAFLYDVFSALEWRGLNIFTYLLLKTIQYLQREGYTTLLTLANEENHTVIKIFENADFQTTDTVVLRFKLLGHQSYRFAKSSGKIFRES